MKLDLKKSEYTDTEYKEYIYGSADVVGLMCLKVFVNGNQEQYDSLEESAMKLGSAFQKVNFLRDLKDDYEELNRSYFPNIDVKDLNNETKKIIIQEIEEDFKNAHSGIKRLPREAQFGVYTAYVYYSSLLKKLKKTPAKDIIHTRIRISNPFKILLLIKSFVTFKTNLI